MPSSQNGYPVIYNEHGFLRKWKIPTTGRHLYLRDGSCGYLLADFALWFHKHIEPLNVGAWDEWGWSPRNIEGTNTISNHASGTAADLNAAKHPLGVQGTFAFKVEHIVGRPERVRHIWAYAKIRLVLARRYRGCIRWGGDYNSRVDSMHFEIDKPIGTCEARARKLMRTRHGRRIIDANPSAAKAIMS